LFVLLYFGLFVVLVLVQFTKRGGFTQRVGSFVVTGQYRLPGENDPPLDSNEYLLDGDSHVFFGGMDFGMIKGTDEHSLYLTQKDGTIERILPERMVISADSARFAFPGGTELEFTAQYTGGSLEMQISGVFSDDITAIALPFNPLRKTAIQEGGDGQFTVSSDGVNYSFSHSSMDSQNKLLLISAEGGRVSYHAIPNQKTFSPGDFILPQAQTAQAYNNTLTRWRDQNFSLWNRTISDQNNEDLVIAFEAEALVRGTYKAAVTAVSPAFLQGSSRTYESSVYLGGLDQAYRSLVSKEREKIARLSRQINEKSLDFLKEPRVFKYFAVRGYNNFIDAGADLVRNIDPASLALDITPGILEGFVDWNTYRPNTGNPFERLVDQACFVISGSLRKTANASGADADGAGERVFSFNGNQGDTEFNIRLGKALLVYAETVQNDSWAGIGRSLILSALSMGDASGLVKDGLLLSGTGEITENSAQSGLTTARLYRILNPVTSYPRALAIGTAANSIWAWTAAQTLSAAQQNDIMDITVRFPAGETHYMIIRGIKPFARIQLYGMDFRSDAQFERYDSSGWVYYAPDQILVLKMKHHTAEEHIKIIFKEAAASPAPAAAASPASAPAAAGSPAPAPAAPAASLAPTSTAPTPAVTTPTAPAAASTAANSANTGNINTDAVNNPSDP